MVPRENDIQLDQRQFGTNPVQEWTRSLHTTARQLFISNQEHTYEELEHIEKRRRAILLRIEEPFWKIITYWDGTVVRLLATNGLFYATCAIYIAMRAWARIELPGYVADIGALNISVLGGFLSFFLVFWVNQSHRRFFDLYKHSMSCKGRIFDTATIVATVLPKDRAFRLIRYMNAANAAGYVGLSKTYSTNNYFMRMNRDLRLLTDKELRRMNDMNLDTGGSCNRELIVWCMQEVTVCHKAGLLDHEMAHQLRDLILVLRAQTGQIFDAADLPIPFFYVHFISLLTALYLPLFAITMAVQAGTGSGVHWTVDIVAGLIVVLQSIFVIGLRILGQKLSDPYGDDLIDLSVMWFVNFTWIHSQRILMTQFPDDVDEEEEQRMALEHVSVGSCWSYNDSFHYPYCKILEDRIDPGKSSQSSACSTTRQPSISESSLISDRNCRKNTLPCGDEVVQASETVCHDDSHLHTSYSNQR